MSEAREASSPDARRGGGVRRLIILAAMVAGVAALVVILTVVRNRPPQIPVAEPTPGKPEISRVDIERITAVSLDGPGRGQPFRMQRTEAGWQIEGADSAIPIKESRIKDILYSFGSLYAERVIEDDADDLGRYGLDPPAVVAVATLDDGATIEVYLGDRTPAGNTWYLGVPGERTVYAVWTNHGNHYYYTVADMRGDEMPSINAEAFSYLLLQGTGIDTLEIVETNPLDARFRHLLTRLAIVQPYAYPRAIDSEEFTKAQATLGTPRIDRIVSDDPEAAAGYGLVPPRYRLLARDTEGSELALLFGEERDGEVFFQVAGRSTVYAMRRSRAAVLDLDPFALVDKFVLILNIETVDAIEIEHPGGSSVLTIERTGSGDDLVESFAIDGAAMEDKPFRELYQLVIGLLGDAALPLADRAAALEAQPEVRITYRMNTPDEVQSVALVPYDRQFLAVVRQGAAEFMVSRAQVARLLDGLSAHTGGAE